MSNQFKEGDRVVWNGRAGTFLRYEDKPDDDTWFPGQRVCVLQWDGDSERIQQEDIESEVRPYVPLTIADVAETYPPGTDVQESGYGYVIAADGTVYALTRQWAHGILCAILFPDVAKEAGYVLPAKGAADAFEYQRFEIDNQAKLPVIRISMGFMSPFNISKNYKPAPHAQLNGLRAVLKAHGKSLSDEVNTNYGDVTVRKLLRDMERDDTPEDAHDLDVP